MRPASIAVEHGAQPVHVHRLAQAVAHGLAHQRVVGHLDGSGRRGCPGRRAGPGTPPPAGPRRACAGAAAARACRPAQRSSASARLAFQRQRVSNIGACSAAWISSSSHVVAGGASRRPSRAGSCAAARARAAMPSSVAAACSSKSKLRQKRLRSAMPQARLMRPPNGAWMTSCMPPASSKKRSAITVVWRGHRAQRRARRPRRSRARSWAPPRVERAVSSASQRTAASRVVAGARPPPRAAAATSADSSRVRAGRLARARTGSWAARRRRPRPAPCRSRPGGCATRCCRAGRRRPPWTRWRSPRRACRSRVPSGSSTTS